MTEVQKTSKLREIKETVSGVVEIIRQIRVPEVHKSFGKIMDATASAKEIVEALKTPEMVKNIENFRLISENMNEISARMQNTLRQLEETGVINETKELVKSAKNVMYSLDEAGQDIQQTSFVIKEMFKSIRALIDELRISTAYSKNLRPIHIAAETIKEATEIYKEMGRKNEYAKQQS